jgi:hypothetical protein
MMLAPTPQSGSYGLGIDRRYINVDRLQKLRLQYQPYRIVSPLTST